VTVQDVMARVGVTKAAVYRRLHGVQTGRFGSRPSKRKAWTKRGAKWVSGRWWIPAKLAEEWVAEKLALDSRSRT
jgi:hypothetical protein